MEDVKFNLDAVNNTFKQFKVNDMYDCVVIQKRQDGAICNIGGKSDGFIPESDFADYSKVLIGERFKVIITKKKNEEGMVEASKSKADEVITGTQKAEMIKLGSIFTFVATGIENSGLISRLGEYKIFIPEEEAIINGETNLKRLVNKQHTALAIEVNNEEKTIIASIKVPYMQEQERIEDTFWKAIFINKVVKGKVERITPFGAFVNVDGFVCLAHISDLSHTRINSVEEVLKEGDVRQFRVIKIDKDAKKVNLGIKQLEASPKKKNIEELSLDQTYSGKVVKILQFGAIVELKNGLTGLLHISNATERHDKKIYEIVKLDQEIVVQPINKDIDNEKVSFKLIH